MRTWYIVDVKTDEIVNAVTCESADLAERARLHHRQSHRLVLLPEELATPAQVEAYERDYLGDGRP